VPVIVPAGAKGVLAVREGDNISELVRTFADLHEIPVGIVAGLTSKVEDTLAKRAARRLLLAMPVSAPDGRTVQLEVRDGEQHDLLRFTAEWWGSARWNQVDP
jgi:ABC-type amino acid transport substrate-binding protein